MISLKIKLNGKVGKHKLEILTLLICSALVVSAYALTYLWSAPSAAAITTSVQNIIVLDSKGNEVTSINFGNLNPSSTIRIPLTIKNTSPNATIAISWSSTLKDVTNKITDQWYSSDYLAYWPITLAPGESRETYYGIMVASDCPMQAFSWTLYIVPG